MNDNRNTPELSAIDAAKLELAQAIEEDPSDIKVKQADWAKLMQQGVIINLHLRRWRARAKLDFSDLGLYDTGNDRELDELINLGEKYLLPPALIKRLDSVETSARTNLEKRAFSTYWGWFMPEKAYPAWKIENSMWKTLYYGIRDEIYQDYDRNLDELLAAYRKAAALAYQRIKALTPGRMTTAERLDEQVFANRFVGKLRELIPSKRKIYDSFAFTEDLTFIPLPSLLAEDNAAADIAYERANVERMKALSERQALYAKESEESEMRRDVMNKAAEQKEELIGGFMNDITGQLRGLVYEASTEILSSIKRNGNLQPRSIVQIRNLIDQLNGLNFFGDREIDKMIARLQFIADQNSDARKTNIGNIEQSFRDIATITRSTLVALGEPPRSPKGQSLVGLGLMSRPPADLIRKARHNLDIKPDTDAPALAPRRARNG